VKRHLMTATVPTAGEMTSPPRGLPPPPSPRCLDA
jgi:hypothetical protein